MNILHLNDQRQWGGGEQQVSLLLRGSALAGCRVFLAGRPGTPIMDRDHGVSDLVRIAAPFRGEWDVDTGIRMARAIRQHRIDVVHAQTSHSHTLACLAVKMAGRGKVVVTRRVIFQPNARALNRWKYRWPDRYIAISRSIAQVLRDFGVPSEKVDVVESGVDPKRFDVAPIPRANLDVAEDTVLIGSVGSLVSAKDYSTLVEAMPAVLREISEAMLLVAGEGPLRGSLESRIRELGLEKRVRLLGFREDVPSILKAFDLFVLCSREEGLGTSILDAMICGVPVVATDAGGIPEMVIHETTGLLVPVGAPDQLAAAIVRMANDTQLQQGCAERAQRLVQTRYSVEAMVAGNLKVYEKVLASRVSTR